MKILLDTNIILDVLDVTRSNAQATNLMIRGLSKESSIKYYCSMDALSTITHIMRAKGNNAKNIIESVAKEFECLSLHYSDAIRANEILENNIIQDYEDAQIISVAERNGCVTIISNDKEMLKNSSKIEIEIVSPENILIGLGYQKDVFGNFTIDEQQDAYIEIAKCGDN